MFCQTHPGHAGGRNGHKIEPNEHGLLVQVKVSKHVDAAGKIYLPYLHEWAHPASDLAKPKLTFLTLPFTFTHNVPLADWTRADMHCDIQ